MAKKSRKIVLVGGGSVAWTPTLLNDLTLTQGLEDAQYVILDIDLEAGLKMVQLGNKMCRNRGLESNFNCTADQKEAFEGSDFVIITISTGDLDAMEYDLKIPEDYKIYHAVGDTVGPGGWARALRNIPVFAEMARNIEKYSPNTMVLNYTNPMSTLTNVFYKVSKLKAAGLCHNLFGAYNVLMKIFNLESEDEIKVRFGGINHFFWMMDLKIRGEDGFELLRRKANGRPLAELVIEAYSGDSGKHSDHWACSELFDTFHCLPLEADRHLCEFFPYYLTGDSSKIQRFMNERTFIEERRQWKAEGKERLDEYLSGKKVLPDKHSREAVANIIEAIINGGELIDVINLPNKGQISNLPKGSIVETLGVVNSIGFTPFVVGELPEQILNLVRPHVINQNMIVEAALEGDMDKAFWALYNDPMCAHLKISEVKEMGMKLLKAHKRYLPQFF